MAYIEINIALTVPAEEYTYDKWYEEQINIKLPTAWLGAHESKAQVWNQTTALMAENRDYLLEHLRDALQALTEGQGALPFP